MIDSSRSASPARDTVDGFVGASDSGITRDDQTMFYLEESVDVGSSSERKFSSQKYSTSTGHEMGEELGCHQNLFSQSRNWKLQLMANLDCDFLFHLAIQIFFYMPVP